MKIMHIFHVLHQHSQQRVMYLVIVISNVMNNDDNDYSPSRLSQNYSRKPMRGGKHYLPRNESQ